MGTLINYRSTFILSFSRREREVLQLIFEGYTSQEIANQLYISQQTVESHRKSMISKAGTRNMFGVIRIAIERGLIAVKLQQLSETRI